jgi:hypothetical protein
MITRRWNTPVPSGLPEQECSGYIHTLEQECSGYIHTLEQEFSGYIHTLVDGTLLFHQDYRSKSAPATFTLWSRSAPATLQLFLDGKRTLVRCCILMNMKQNIDNIALQIKKVKR